jgi:hypothetical protein
MHRVSAVIPAVDEAGKLSHDLPLIPLRTHEVILVDGQSTDGTATVARGLLPRIRLVQQHGPGKGSALRVPLPVRADSLLGLVRPATSVPNPDVLERLGVTLRVLSANGHASSSGLRRRYH